MDKNVFDKFDDCLKYGLGFFLVPVAIGFMIYDFFKNWRIKNEW